MYKGRGRYSAGSDLSNPSPIEAYGVFIHPSEDCMLFKALDYSRVPKFNSPVFLENKVEFGYVNEILGPINEFFFSVQPKEGFGPSYFKKDEKCYISVDRFLPSSMFLEENVKKNVRSVAPARGRPARRGGRQGAFRGRGGRGGYRGGYNNNRGARGGFRR